jgi:hypothetical protein
LSRKEKTIVKSFRVSQSAFQILEAEAASQNVTLNTLLNQIVIRYASWGRFVNKYKGIVIGRSAFERLLSVSSDEVVAELGRKAGSDTPKTIMFAKHGEVSLDAVLDYIRGGATYGGFAEYSEVEKQGKTVITLIHNLGPKGSIYLSNNLQSIFDVAGLHPKISSTEQAVLIEI